MHCKIDSAQKTVKKIMTIENPGIEKVSGFFIRWEMRWKYFWGVLKYKFYKRILDYSKQVGGENMQWICKSGGENMQLD